MKKIIIACTILSALFFNATASAGGSHHKKFNSGIVIKIGGGHYNKFKHYKRGHKHGHHYHKHHHGHKHHGHNSHGKIIFFNKHHNRNHHGNRYHY